MGDKRSKIMRGIMILLFTWLLVGPFSMRGEVPTLYKPIVIDEVEDYQKAIDKLAADVAMVQFKVGYCYEELLKVKEKVKPREYEKIIAVYKDVVDKYPNSIYAALAQLRIGEIYYYRLNDLEKAHKAYKGLEGYPDVVRIDRGGQTYEIKVKELAAERLAKGGSGASVGAEKLEEELVKALGVKEDIAGIKQEKGIVEAMKKLKEPEKVQGLLYGTLIERLVEERYLLQFKRGYYTQFRSGARRRNIDEALKIYQEIVPPAQAGGCMRVAPSQPTYYAPLAQFMIAQIYDFEQDKEEKVVKAEYGKAKAFFETAKGGCAQAPPRPKVIYRVNDDKILGNLVGSWFIANKAGVGISKEIDVKDLAGLRLDWFEAHASFAQGLWAGMKGVLYKLLDLVVRLCGGNPKYSYGLALIVLALLVKIILNPFSKKQYKSMKEMQKLQPLMQKIQTKYKDKPREMQKKMMELYKQHGVNPLGGCLPMLLQMPFLILLFRAIWAYDYQFSKAQFLWIKNLAAPDMPLFITYIFSMWLTSELTTVPPTDPQQARSQSMMTLMMPLMFAIFFKGFASAFILYWLVFNILATVQQYLVMRAPEAEPAASVGQKRGGRGK